MQRRAEATFLRAMRRILILPLIAARQCRVSESSHRDGTDIHGIKGEDFKTSHDKVERADFCNAS
jgi:hypothetical protein